MMINQSVKIAILTCILFLSACAGEVKPEDPVIITPVPQLLEQGKQKLQSRKNVAAIFFYQQALEQEPNNIAALLGIADASLAVNKLADAGRFYEQVLLVEPDNLHATEGKGLIYLKIYEYKKARKQFDEVLNNDNTRWRSLNALGIISDLEGSHEDAQQYFKKVLSADKTNVTVLNNLGYSLMMSHQYSAAEDVFRKGLNYAPGFFRIRNNLAISLAWQSRFDTAIKVLIQVVKKEVAYNNIGYIAMLNKQYSVAEDYFKKAITLSPNYYVRAARNLEKVETLMRLGDDPL